MPSSLLIGAYPPRASRAHVGKRFRLAPTCPTSSLQLNGNISATTMTMINKLLTPSNPSAHLPTLSEKGSSSPRKSSVPNRPATD